MGHVAREALGQLAITLQQRGAEVGSIGESQQGQVVRDPRGRVDAMARDDVRDYFYVAGSYSDPLLLTALTYRFRRRPSDDQ
jgi:hypothetical protein